MTPFVRHVGIAAALLHHNIDTDAIIPSREIRTVGKDGLAHGLFANWRYCDVATREPEPDFVLNQPQQHGTTILLTGRNFGCGSSREHAVWALVEWGIRAIVAPSFGAIFFENCIRNGIAPVVLPESDVKTLANSVSSDPQVHLLTVDLMRRELLGPNGISHSINLGEEERDQLLTGLDPIGRTLQQHSTQIEAFEAEDRICLPWMYVSTEDYKTTYP
ncbi:3-isopropylmalate/(R)-2-methylmalate dehydratase small subunit [Polaromonas sp. OV174]|uniref:3-isopropylmalate dehydratase small subunit n=1 Tax=Polaromonas sp. OV174 TaxID=1855300 RepID=UPI0008F3A4E4|nr:3-isopropylmalate dehydratase small subunit [Polaromonas sp. OV174]SFC03081.1 3-isopropylmalate/(R)-2-methylmalate dehydratase small subunit [Polaromonas sp. OV174]